MRGAQLLTGACIVGKEQELQACPASKPSHRALGVHSAALPHLLCAAGGPLLLLVAPVVGLLFGAQGPLVVLLTGGGLGCCLGLTACVDGGGRGLGGERGGMGWQSVGAMLGAALTAHSMGAALFFCSGHWAAFTGLQYASPFIGWDAMQWWVSPLLLWLNTFGGMLLGGLAMSTLTVPQHLGQQQGMRQRLHWLAVAAWTWPRTVTLCVMCVCCTALRDNGLVWSVIAPRFVFEVCFTATAAAVVLLSC